jgi:hypothetical protein
MRVCVSVYSRNTHLTKKEKTHLCRSGSILGLAHASMHARDVRVQQTRALAIAMLFLVDRSRSRRRSSNGNGQGSWWEGHSRTDRQNKDCACKLSRAFLTLNQLTAGCSYAGIWVGAWGLAKMGVEGVAGLAPYTPYPGS